MKKQYLLLIAGVFSVILLFFLGRTTEDKIPVSPVPKAQKNPAFSLPDYIQKQKSQLSPEKQAYVSQLEQEAKNGSFESKQFTYNKLASFWGDSVPNPPLFAYYSGELSKLENSEKKLNFAAQLFLDVLRNEKDEAIIDWLASNSIELFEKAIQLNPENDDLKIGLGSVYIFGKGRGGAPEETMKGIQQILSVARKDSTNMKAQLMLGIGGYVSGQYDKAITRLQRVVNAQPENIEAVAFLADTYAANGNKTEAIRWYQVLKRLANDSHHSKEIDARINQLK